MSLKDTILSACDLQVEAVEVPEWKTTVYVKVMTAGEREAFEVRATNDKKNLIPLLLAYTVCDEAGNLAFSPDDVEALSHKNVKALWRLHEVASRLNRLTSADVDDAEKN